MSSVQASPITVKISRAWKDLAPKLVAFLTTGLTASGLVTVAAYFGLILDVGFASALVVAIGAIAGYFVTDKAIIDAGTVAPAQVAVVTALYESPDAPAEDEVEKEGLPEEPILDDENFAYDAESDRYESKG